MAAAPGRHGALWKAQPFRGPLAVAPTPPPHGFLCLKNTPDPEVARRPPAAPCLSSPPHDNPRCPQHRTHYASRLAALHTSLPASQPPRVRTHLGSLPPVKQLIACETQEAASPSLPVPPANGPAAAAQSGLHRAPQIQIGALAAACLPPQGQVHSRCSAHVPAPARLCVQEPGVSRSQTCPGVWASPPAHSRGRSWARSDSASWSVRWGNPNTYPRLVGSRRGLLLGW